MVNLLNTSVSIDTKLKKQFGLGRLLRKNKATLKDWQKLKIEAYLETHPQIKILYEITQDLMSLMNEKMCKYKDCKQRLIPKLLKYIELLKDCGFSNDERTALEILKITDCV